MSQPELKFQKELVQSARKSDCLADITTHRFKKGWPDLYWKKLDWPAIHIECKYEDISARVAAFDPLIKINTTELQRICLNNMRLHGVIVAVMIKVTIDKKQPKVYTVWDIDARELLLNDPASIVHSPTGTQKGLLVWPIIEMTGQLLHL